MGPFNLDISDSSIEVLTLKKSLFGKLKVSSFKRVELEEGVVRNGEVLDKEKLGKKIGEIVKGQKINFTVPDLRVFIYRVQVPLDISYSASLPFLKDKVVEVIPYDFDDLAYDFKVLTESKKGKDVLFVAISKKILFGYLKVFENLKLTPLFAVPESVAAFEFFKETLTKDEIVLVVDIGGKTSTLSFFDRFGPLLTLNEPVETKALKEGVKKALAFLKEKYGKEVKRVILGGGGSLKIDSESFSKEIKIWTTKAEKILEDKLLKIPLGYNFGKLPPILFLNVLGLSLLSIKKEELNLLKSELKEFRKSKPKKKTKEEIREGVEEEKIGKKGTIFLLKFLRGILKLKQLLIIAVVAFLTFFGVYILKSIPTKEKKGEAPTPSPLVSHFTPTPIPKLERNNLKIKVLNGSGVAGKAKDVATILEDLGYSVVEVGNASSFDYEETVIKIRSDKKDFLTLLTNDLKTLYTLSKEETLLSQEEKVDALVIVGKK